MIGRHVVALEHRLKACRNVLTLGVKPNWRDYGEEAMRRILASPKIYYPSAFYAELLDAAGKITFPSRHTYSCAQDKIRQTALFNLLGIPHPRTRVFYGKTQREAISDHFGFPLIAKIPRGSAMGRGVFLVENSEQLAAYLEKTAVAYIQAYLPARRDIRVVVIGCRPRLAYWRVAPEGDFRANVSRGGRIDFKNVPEEAVALAVRTARMCRWDDVGIDILAHEGGYFVLEGNMKYGRRGFSEAGVDYALMMEKLIETGEI